MAVEDSETFCPNCSAISGDKGKVSRLKVFVNLSQAPPGCDPEFIACPCCSPSWETMYHTPMKCPRQSSYPVSTSTRYSNEHSSTRRVAPPPTPSIPTPTEPAGTNYMAAASGIGVFNRNSGRGNRSASRTNESSAGRGQTREVSSGPECNCGEPSVSRTVGKEGENKGRVFYTCAKPRGEQCKYFCWADELSSSRPSTPSTSWRGGYSAGRSAGRGRGGGRNSDGNVMICSRCKQSGHFARNCPTKE